MERERIGFLLLAIVLGIYLLVRKHVEARRNRDKER